MKRHPEMGTKDLVRYSQLNMTFNQVECSEKQTEWPKEQHGPLAQLAEQRTFNPRVAGSIPVRPTRKASTDVLGQNNPLLNDQSGQPWPAGFLLPPLHGWGYNIITDNADETLLPNSKQFCSLLAPLTLPESALEVVS